MATSAPARLLPLGELIFCFFEPSVLIINAKQCTMSFYMRIVHLLPHFVPSYRVRPAELIDKCVGSKLWVVLKNNKEFVGGL